MSYTSSIIRKYGDIPNLKRDIATLTDILNRQGAILLIDTIAENSGNVANKLKLDSQDRFKMIKDLSFELKEALQERL